MGYTHYWYRQKKIDSRKFKKIVDDFLKIKPILERIGVKLCDGNGEGEAVINYTKVCFNGDANCNHQQRNLGITWAGEGSKGVALVAKSGAPVKTDTIITALTGQQESLNLNDSDIAGSWFAGAKLKARTCGGDCSHETFYFPQDWSDIPDWRNKENEGIAKGLYFDCTKTAYKPYDLAVNCFLIIAKHYLAKKIVVHSDGEQEHWQDAMELCHKFLGYGMDFRLKEGE